MPSLSIVIPVQGSVDALERSLVSVLENRPADSEIIVVLNTSYDDPYQLTDEVRFVAASAGASWSECVATGLAAARAGVVHLLAAGVEVSEGWSQPALEHFRDTNVWAVAPATHDRCQRERLLSAGVDDTPAADRLAAGSQASIARVLGPAWWGGFYRCDLLDPVLAAFDSGMPAAIAACDLAWRQTLAGRRCVAEPRARLFVPAGWETPLRGFGDGYQSERFFLRRRADRHSKPSLAGHLLLLMALALGGFLRPRKWLHLAGKCAAWPMFVRFYREGQRTVAAAANSRSQPDDAAAAPHMLKQRTPSARSGFSKSPFAS